MLLDIHILIMQRLGSTRFYIREFHPLAPLALTFRRNGATSVIPRTGGGLICRFLIPINAYDDRYVRDFITYTSIYLYVSTDIHVDACDGFTVDHRNPAEKIRGSAFREFLCKKAFVRITARKPRRQYYRSLRLSRE